MQFSFFIDYLHTYITHCYVGNLFQKKPKTTQPKILRENIIILRYHTNDCHKLEVKFLSESYILYYNRTGERH